MNRAFIYFLLIVCLNFKSRIASAQYNPFYIQIHQKEKLPGSSVYDVFQDSKGFIWVSTDKGLSRYDGFDFKTYTHPAQTSLPGTNISEDFKGRIWYQNFDGFIYYTENDSLKPVLNIFPSAFHPYVLNENKLFFLDDDAIKILDIQNLTTKTVININTLKLKALIKIPSGVVVFTNKGKFLIDNNVSIKPLKNNLNFLFANLGNTQIGDEIWVYSKNSYPQEFFRYNKAFQFLDSFHVALPFLIQDVVEVDGKVYICHNKGIDILNPNLQTKSYLRGFSVSTLIKDQNQNLWASTIGGGLLLILNSESANYTFSANKPCKIIKSKNGFFLSTKDGFVYELDKELNITKKIIEDPKNAEIYYLNFDSTSNLLFVTGNNFLIYDTQTHEDIFTYTDPVKEIVKVGDNRYASASSNIVGYYNLSNKKNGNHPHLHQDIEPIKAIRAKGIDYNPSTDELLISSNKGLFCFKDRTSHEIRFNDNSFYANKAYWLENNIIALSTMGDLFLISNKSNFIKLNTIIGIQNQSVSNLKVMGNRIGFIANGEFLIFDYKAQKLLHSGFFKEYTEVNDFIAYDTSLIIVTNNGLIKENFKIERKKQPLFYINTLSVAGKFTEVKKLNYLKNTQNNISIQYSILNFGFEKPFQLKYKINKGPWEITNPDSRTLEFQSLAPDDYKIQFMLNSKILDTTLEFKIYPPYWDTWWFYLIAFLSVTFLIYLYLNRQYGLMKKQILLTQEKTNLERELNKSVMTSIRSQMNPHFFYNALNTIQAFIFTNDKTRANNYLAKFSKLTRLILENSEKETIILCDEINSLQLYLELEKIRFKDTFEYSIQIAENLDADNTEIPPMLIQPYVENAIKHGLLHLESTRVLKINFEINNKLLFVIIDDNGVGRKRSEEINNMKHEKPESFSTKANQSRLEILNKGKTNKIGVDYSDKVDSNGKPLGTTVTLTIPI